MSAESVASSNEPAGASRLLQANGSALSALAAAILAEANSTRQLRATATDKLHYPTAPSAAGLSQQEAADGEQQQSSSDWWLDYWSRKPFPSGYTQSSITLLACLITTIIFLIVVGNLLVCIAIFTEKSLKPTQNWFIASLAVSDMLLGLVVMPFSLARELMGFWIFGPLWCDIHEAIDVLLSTASINFLCLISLDRYWSITQAVSYLKKRTPKRGALMIAFVWVFSAAVSLPPLFGWKKQSPSILANSTGLGNRPAKGAAAPPATPLLGPQELATEYPSCQLSDDVGYVLYSALGSFFIPCGVMVFTYIKIFLAARSRARRAISKQSRCQQAAGKRLQAAASRGRAPDAPAAPKARDRGRPADCAAPGDQEPLVKGKLVIVERRKSTCAAGARPGQPSAGDRAELVQLTTSEAKQASLSALAGGQEASTITVMSASMGELPVTRFNFQQPTALRLDPGAGPADEGRKVAALLQAISQAGASQPPDEAPADQSAGEPPDIVVERRATGSGQLQPAGRLEQLAAEQQQQQTGATNETCFMTIEEDSDMFDAQTGRTIVMVAGNRKQPAGELAAKMVALMPAPSADQLACANSACRLPFGAANRSASSYCGSSLTINDEDELDVDDELMTDDCNGYSASCALDQFCPQPAAHCPHCEAFERDERDRLGRQEPASAGHQPRPAQQQQQRQHLSPVSPADGQPRHAGCLHELEAQSVTADDNLSMTECRSNEDESSIVGHDVLDATDSPERDRPTEPASWQRKKSSIGFRLAKLGAGAPPATQSGALLALASSQQQQASANSTARNLKSLRQNFFLKLNQIAAKSAARQSRKSESASPTGKSSAQSSGTSYEPSVDCATTSNLHSAEYQPETITGDTNQSQDKSARLTGGLEASRAAHGDHRSPATCANNQNHAPHGPQLGQATRDGGEARRHLLPADSMVSSQSSAGARQEPAPAASAGRQQPAAAAKRNPAGAGQINRSSTIMSSSAGTNSATNRAYLASDNERHKRKLAKARERRATLILGLIMAAFICSWLPFFTFYVLRALCTTCREFVPPRFEAFIFWMGYCNSAINPIIYTIFNRDFRRAFRKILFKCL